MNRPQRLTLRPGPASALFFALCLGAALFLSDTAYAARARDERLGPAQYAAVTEARALLDKGDPAGAVKRLLPVADDARPPLPVLDHLAWAQERAGDHGAALATYRKAAALYPDDPGTLRNLGILLFNQRHFADAARTLERAYGLQPEGAREPALLAMAGSAQARLNHFVKALRLLDRAGHTGGKVPVAWSAMAVYCCQRLERPDDALARSRACAQSHPASPAAWTLLGRVLARHGDPLAAASALETAKALRPGLGASGESEELAALYALGHAHAEAARCLAADDGPDTTLRRAGLLWLAGDNRAALDALDRFDREAAASDTAVKERLRAALLRGRILRDMGKQGAAVDGLLAAAKVIRPPAADRTGQRLRGALLLLAGELRWAQRDWTGAARIFDALAEAPGYGETGASLAAGMRAMAREAALAPAPLRELPADR
ncbi:tetratricopeptide repeat protein [Pseudodesulfovibrio methanolicus]|uniref:Tetratricopeptide repeat protein n=1 Tax=Pseudodesulfovibrio methanolicus TaxID=3126690 RepID=A0ABZ2IUC0_9BACT